jgi:hypothetical protein
MFPASPAEIQETLKAARMSYDSIMSELETVTVALKKSENGGEKRWEEASQMTNVLNVLKTKHTAQMKELSELQSVMLEVRQTVDRLEAELAEMTKHGGMVGRRVEEVEMELQKALQLKEASTNALYKAANLANQWSGMGAVAEVAMQMAQGPTSYLDSLKPKAAAPAAQGPTSYLDSLAPKAAPGAGGPVSYLDGLKSGSSSSSASSSMPGSYMDHLSSGAKSAPSTPVAPKPVPAPVVKAAPAPVAKAPAAAPAGPVSSGSYLDMLNGGKSAPSPAAAAAGASYLEMLNGPKSSAPSVDATATGSYLQTLAPKRRPGSTSVGGGAPSSYLDALNSGIAAQSSASNAALSPGSYLEALASGLKAAPPSPPVVKAAPAPVAAAAGPVNSGSYLDALNGAPAVEKIDAMLAVQEAKEQALATTAYLDTLMQEKTGELNALRSAIHTYLESLSEEPAAPTSSSAPASSGSYLDRL